jgi:hypothetical protein
MPAHVLVVADVTAASRTLLEALVDRAQRGPIRVTLVMPARTPGLGGREAMRERLDEVIASWREAGLDADGVVGDTDPLEAVGETWDQARHDEAIVSTLPGQSSKWIASDLPHCVARLTGAPVTHVVASDMRPALTHGPPPTREQSPLGPLSVLAWGGRRS